MALLKFDNIGIAALAGALPGTVQKINLDPTHPRATYIANFVRQTGIRERHMSLSEQTTTDLGFIAMLKALDRAGWEAASLDALIFLSQTPDFNPATGNASILHNHLHLSEDAFVFDITQGCASFPYGLAVCSALLQQPHINRMAMVSGDTMWHMYPSPQAILDDPVFMVGEGTTALLLEKKDSTPLDISLHSDGSGYHFLYNPWEGTRNAWRRTPGVLPNGVIYNGGGYMDGLEITTFSTTRVVDSIKAFLGKVGKNIDDYDGLVLHQANKQIVKTMARRLKMPVEKVPTTFEKFANTNGASVTLTMLDAYAGKNETLKLLISAFGIGLSWGIVSLDVDTSVFVPLVETDHRFDEDFLKPLTA